MKDVLFGCIVPHPPLLVPDIGRGQERTITATIQAMGKLRDKLSQQRPEVVLVISPHGASHPNAMGVLTAGSCVGSLRQWGAKGIEYHFENDLEFVSILTQQAKKANIPLKSIATRGYELDHGVMVPMYFLVKGVEGIPLVPLTFSWLPLTTHLAFGRVIKETAEQLGKKTAVIASGDLSHRLLPGAPAGYDPMGKLFDHKLVDLLAKWDIPAILNLDPDLIERAGECGLRSIVILLGALEGLSVTSEILSYEGPFGVGYLVASFGIETASPQGHRELPALVILAKEAVEAYVKEGRIIKPKGLTPEMKERAGVFVSLKKWEELRGCIGTFEPTQANVAEETIANAISSAVRDPRFPPVNSAELSHLDYSVDVLSQPEPVETSAQLDPRKYGVIVESGGRRGLLLPDLQGVDSAEQQVEICRRKAGILPQEPIKLYRFEVKRFK